MDMYTKAAWLIPMFPLAAFLVLTALGKGFRRTGPVIGSLAALASFVLSLLVLLERLKPDALDYGNSFEWISIGSYSLRIGFEVTNLTSLMLVVVTLVSLLVNVYSAGYMKRDERITLFYGYMSLFGFSMLGLTLSDNLLSFYLFWELVGVCSFLLIGFWYTRPAARAAAKKAFIVTRIGDAGLLLAMLLLFWYMPAHGLEFTMIQTVFGGSGGAISEAVATAAALLVFLGAAGKSGQFPLHVWLPDAMEGPTPISALIHAATMVAAGVFLIARTFDIFLAAPAAMEAVAYIGAFTAIFAATIALVQNDIKRILAYSTISQLGLMMLALGLGSVTGAMFHLLTHAFFKALLFLGAGSVIHAAGAQNISEMGGLAKRMKGVAWTFGIGALALAGIPPLSGFWSKELILASALEANPTLFAVALAVTFCTALYMSRLFAGVFLGKERGGSAASRINDAAGSQASGTGLLMLLPLVALAGLAVVSGFLETPWSGLLGGWLYEGEEAGAHAGAFVPLVSAIVALTGLALGWLLYGQGLIDRWKPLRGQARLVHILEHGYYVDRLYERLAVGSYRLAGVILDFFDQYVIGGLAGLVGAGAKLASKTFLRLHNGQVQTYGLAAAIGALLFVLAIVGRRLLS